MIDDSGGRKPPRTSSRLSPLLGRLPRVHTENHMVEAELNMGLLRVVLR